MDRLGGFYVPEGLFLKGLFAVSNYIGRPIILERITQTQRFTRKLPENKAPLLSEINVSLQQVPQNIF